MCRREKCYTQGVTDLLNTLYSITTDMGKKYLMFIYLCAGDIEMGVGARAERGNQVCQLGENCSKLGSLLLQTFGSGHKVCMARSEC